MEIIVEGKGSNLFTPNEIRMSIDFFVKGNSYAEVLQKGTNNVLDFVNNLLSRHGFQKDDMKTRNFVIKEENKYNELTRKYDFDGYSYNQSATLRFDYSIEKISTMMEAISKLNNPPYCQINFGINNEKECKKEILTKAYKDAEEKASAIAIASGKVLKQCMKVDFKPFTTDYTSQSHIGNEMMYVEKSMIGSAKAINNIFTPEDIEVSEKLYCLWIAE